MTAADFALLADAIDFAITGGIVLGAVAATACSALVVALLWPQQEQTE